MKAPMKQPITNTNTGKQGINNKTGNVYFSELNIHPCLLISAKGSNRIKGNKTNDSYSMQPQA